MKKIVEVPDECKHLHIMCYGKSAPNTHINSQPFLEIISKVEDLPDYDEPRTADGLTLKEFLEKANGNLSNVELINGKIKESFWNGLSSLIIAFIEDPEIMKDYRLKPEKKHIPWTRETAPDWFESSCGCVFEVAYNRCAEQYGYNTDNELWYTFAEVLNGFKKADGTPCGQEIS